MRFATLFVLFLGIARATGQWTSQADKYEEYMVSQEVVLDEELKSGDYVEDFFYPARSYEDVDVYSYDFPPSSDYAIGLIVDPCLGGEYDCCNGVYGAPEYAILTDHDDLDFRLEEKTYYADAGEILANVLLVGEDGSAIDADQSRLADDEIVIDESCVAEGNPHSYCVGAREANVRSSHLAPCMDNNQTVDSTAGCYDVEGNALEYCTAVAYSQTALSVVCGGDYADDEHCGTFIEVHMANANDYLAVEDIISETKITTTNTTGYTTTTVDLTWQNDSNKVLCALEYSSILLDNMVLIAEDAPSCCCPAKYSQGTSLGSFVCPLIDDDEGPFAVTPEDIDGKFAHEAELKEYPFCPGDLDVNEDKVMVSDYSSAWNRSYTREADTVRWDNDTKEYSSNDLEGGYEDVCGYFDACGAMETSGSCTGNDVEYSFAGYKGKVTFVPSDLDEGQYGVTFNDGRTSYYFNDEHVQLEFDHNFELWWVQRTRYNFIVQRRKAFAVASPTCTFDDTNNRYFPYAILSDGEPLA